MFKSLIALAGAMFAMAASAQTVSGEAPIAPRATGSAAVTPAPAPSPENILYLDLSTGGRVAILLRPDKAPGHVTRIKTLVRRHFYDGQIFHRVIEDFMAQTGDPQGTGQGGSDLPDLQPEFNDLLHVRGTVSMARTEKPDSANSQFFIMLQTLLRLDGQYTAFGRVIDGMQWVDKIARGEPPANPSKILQASIAADNVPPPNFAAALAAAAAAPAPSPTIAPRAPTTVEKTTVIGGSASKKTVKR